MLQKVKLLIIHVGSKSDLFISVFLSDSDFNQSKDSQTNSISIAGVSFPTINLEI